MTPTSMALADDAGDRDAIMRHAACEIRGAVDRIDDPDWRALLANEAVALFADEAVIWKYCGQPRLNEPLDFAVDLGDEILRSFEPNSERAAIEEAPARQGAGLPRDRAGGEETALQRGSIDRQSCLHGRACAC